MAENTTTNSAENNELMENEAIEETAAKTYTRDEVLKLLQSETDKRVTQALKSQQKKYEKQLSLSKLDGAEREKAEKDNRIAELEEQLASFQVERNKSELKSVLASRGLSAEFADILAITDDIEASQATIDTLDNLFKKAVKDEVEKRLASSAGAPKGGTVSAENVSREAFAKMSLAERAQLLRDNPELYDRLTK